MRCPLRTLYRSMSTSTSMHMCVDLREKKITSFGVSISLFVSYEALASVYFLPTGKSQYGLHL